jgi:hypothetical protein
MPNVKIAGKYTPKKNKLNQAERNKRSYEGSKAKKLEYQKKRLKNDEGLRTRKTNFNKNKGTL